tara:strand:- start:40394 stop:40609 length:216 start_codon:yes stop_codon:yes gene_type:complete
MEYYINDNDALVQYDYGCGCCAESRVVNAKDSDDYYSTVQMSKEDVIKAIKGQIESHQSDILKLTTYMENQ